MPESGASFMARFPPPRHSSHKTTSTAAVADAVENLSEAKEKTTRKTYVLAAQDFLGK